MLGLQSPVVIKPVHHAVAKGLGSQSTWRRILQSAGESRRPVTHTRKSAAVIISVTQRPARGVGLAGDLVEIVVVVGNLVFRSCRAGQLELHGDSAYIVIAEVIAGGAAAVSHGHQPPGRVTTRVGIR